MRNDLLIKQVREIRKKSGNLCFDKNGHPWSGYIPVDLLNHVYVFRDFLPDFVADAADPVKAADFIEAFVYFCSYHCVEGRYNAARDQVCIYEEAAPVCIARDVFIRYLMNIRSKNPVFVLTLAEKLLPDQFRDSEPIQERLI